MAALDTAFVSVEQVLPRISLAILGGPHDVPLLLRDLQLESRNASAIAIIVGPRPVTNSPGLNSKASC